MGELGLERKIPHFCLELRKTQCPPYLEGRMRPITGGKANLWPLLVATEKLLLVWHWNTSSILLKDLVTITNNEQKDLVQNW